MLRGITRTGACRFAAAECRSSSISASGARHLLDLCGEPSTAKRSPRAALSSSPTTCPSIHQCRRNLHTTGEQASFESWHGVEGSLTPINDLLTLPQGANVVLAGWIVKLHVLGEHLAFATLLLPRGQGRIQLVVRQNADVQGSARSSPVADTDVVRAWQAAGLHGVVQVEGVFGHRPASQQREHHPLASFEVTVRRCTILNAVKTNSLPFDPVADPRSTSSLQSVASDLRMRYRTLALRNETLGGHIRLRSKVTHAIRQLLHERNFDEVETPVLLRSTPEGAREFLVPARVTTSSSSASKDAHMPAATTQSPQFYALQQSPQQPKQLLVASGVTNRYFQIARCFRDEDGRKDRQPEFTQIDVEMSFVSRCRNDSEWTLGAVEVRVVVEEMVRAAWEAAGRAEELSSYGYDGQFPVMTYDDAMRRFGSDKPDLRYGMELVELGEALQSADAESTVEKEPFTSQVEVLCFTPPNGSGGALSRSTIKDALAAWPSVECFWDNEASPNVLAKLLLRKSSIVQKFLGEHDAQAEQVDVIRLSNAIVEARRRGAVWSEGGGDSNGGPTCLLVASKSAYSEGGATILGDVRQTLMQLMQQKQPEIAGLLNKQGPRFAWIVDFPLFTRADADKDFLARGRWSSTHHPFTSPKEDDVHKLLDALSSTDSDPAHKERILSSIKGQHYDLVLNGMEIGGGSVRIHRADLQRSILRDVLQLAPHEVARFDHLLTALSHGAPPHAGIALGLDRLMAILCDTPTIRDVIAFPKSVNGRDQMLGCPDQLGNSGTAASHEGQAEEASLLRMYGLQRASK